MRIYDPRIAKFLSVDPITKQYPELTPYQFASNRPIDGIDLDGLEYAPPMKIDKNGERVVDGEAQLKQMRATGEYAIGLFQSFYQGLSALKEMIRSPIKSAHGIVDAVSSPVKTAVAIKEDYAQSIKENQTRAYGKISGDILQLVYGGKLMRSIGGGEISSLLKTKRGSAFFWSGKTEGIGGAGRALEIATAKGGTTLEGLIESKGIKMPAWDINSPTSIAAWEKVSAEFAAGVSGKVSAVIGENLRPGNIWENVELKALKANKKVTEIITIDPKTLKETTIFKR